MHALPQLLVQLIAIIVLGRLLARALRPLGQPAVIAEIVAGVVLGPSCLGAVSPGAMTWLFPAPSMAPLSLVAQLGLVLFMFLIGLEFDPKLLAGRGRASMIISQMSIIAPFTLGAALAWAIHGGLAPEGVPLSSFALFMGAAMSITAFPVLARILAESGLLRTEVGAISLACAAINDVSAWVILAFVVAFAGSEGVGGAMWTAGLTVAYIAAMVRFVRPILARLGPRGAGDVSSEVIATVFVAIFASSMVTELIGIHALFGAFMLGAVMPREGGLVHALAHKLEDVVTIGLLPLFFAFSGLRTEIGLLDDALAWQQCAAIIAVACLGKFLGSTLPARAIGLGWREASAIGVLMNTRGLMELIVLNIGLDLGVISPRLFAMMVIMALVTTWMTSPILARIIAAPAEATPSPAPAALLCVSDPALAPTLVYVGRALAERGPLVAVHVESVDRPSVYLRGEGRADERGPLASIRDASEEAGLAVELVSEVAPDPAEAIAELAAARGVGAVVLGTHHAVFIEGAFSGIAGALLDQVRAQVVIVEDRRLGAVGAVTVQRVAGPDLAAAEALAARLPTDPAGQPVVVVPWHAVEGDGPGFPEAAAVIVVRAARS